MMIDTDEIVSLAQAAKRLPVSDRPCGDWPLRKLIAKSGSRACRSTDAASF